ncbi:MAG: multicopper oxidase domain-containing protein, partial [Pseudomonadota bacterium]
FTNINPKTGQPLTLTPTVNVMTNFGNEYVWHCHLLGHEENDMMRPLVVRGTFPIGALDLLLLD